MSEKSKKVDEMFSETTKELVKKFLLNRSEFEQSVAQQPSQGLAIALKELLALYANDKNSSTLREWIVLHIAGCEPLRQTEAEETQWRWQLHRLYTRAAREI